MLKIALGQMNILPGRPENNARKMLAMIKQAKEQKAHIIIFPEMAVPGSMLGDTWEQAAFLRECEEFGRQIVKASDGIVIIFGNVAVDWKKQGNDGRPRKYNACFIAHNDSLIAPEEFEYPFFIKMIQSNYQKCGDSRHFYGLSQLAADMDKDLKSLLNTIEVKIDDQDSITLGCWIGEDDFSQGCGIFHPVTVSRAGRHPDLFINISSSTFTPGKNNKRKAFFLEYAKKINAPLIYLNHVGLQNTGKTVYVFDGCSSAYDFKGGTIHHCSSFLEETAFIEMDFKKERQGKEVQACDDSGISSIYRAINYAITGFLNAAGMKKVVIGASGGIDSAVSAALYAKAVGPENLLLVNMPSKFNSPITKKLAKELAESLGCLYTVMPIDNWVDGTISQISRTPVISFGSGEEFNLEVTPFMAENIQARDRSSRLLAGIAASFGAVFTCNANKSEITVGYSTLYGDQAGFFAVTADLWKHQIYELANYLNQSVYGRQVIPQATIDIVPSAELSLSQDISKGQGDPLVYPYHDYLFRAFAEYWERVAPEDILAWRIEGVLEEKIGCKKGLVNRIFKNNEEFIADLEKWWTLFTGMGVAKRIQAPPVLALSRRPYGFDYRESQNGTYYTQRYFTLKSELCRAKSSWDSL